MLELYLASPYTEIDLLFEIYYPEPIVESEPMTRDCLLSYLEHCVEWD